MFGNSSSTELQGKGHRGHRSGHIHCQALVDSHGNHESLGHQISKMGPVQVEMCTVASSVLRRLLHSLTFKSFYLIMYCNKLGYIQLKFISPGS